MSCSFGRVVTKPPPRSLEEAIKEGKGKMMDARVKRMWLDALRSGEFEQGKGELVTSDGRYCCLGVLCELAAREGVVNRVTISTEFRRGRSGIGYGSDEVATSAMTRRVDDVYLPLRVVEWSGVDSTMPMVSVRLATGLRPNTVTDLAHVNDGGATFEEIADLIEEQL